MFAGTLSISEGSTVAIESTLFSNNTGTSGATVQVQETLLAVHWNIL